jgi:hypothetical protein
MKNQGKDANYYLERCIITENSLHIGRFPIFQRYVYRFYRTTFNFFAELFAQIHYFFYQLYRAGHIRQGAGHQIWRIVQGGI